jgi:hypothetical protein
MAVARVCDKGAHMNAHIITNTPAVHALNRVIVVVLSESVLVSGMGRILARRRSRLTRVFDGRSRRHAELDGGPGERSWSSRQAASSKAGAAAANPRQNEAVMSPRVRQQIRLIAGVWLAWTIAGLFYISQDSVPRLYRGEAVPWKYVFVGWMAGMYVCAALTPALLWLGDRWPAERRVTYAGLHLCFSVVFSILATVIEVPLLLLLGVFPASTPPPSIAAGARVMLSFGIQGGVIRYWGVIALQAVYRSQKNAKIRER